VKDHKNEIENGRELVKACSCHMYIRSSSFPVDYKSSNTHVF
jgi:hypothetical protein